jgi:hypothetical protein
VGLLIVGEFPATWFRRRRLSDFGVAEKDAPVLDFGGGRDHFL